MHLFPVLSVLFPIFAGAVLWHLQPADRRWRNQYAMTAVLASSVFIFASLLLTARFGADATEATLLRFGHHFAIAFRIDGASTVFGAIIATLWPLTTLYAFSYMEHEGRENKFFSFFLMTYGVVAGIAFARDFFTLYLFYELMTLATLPLVMHSMDAKARSAGRKYLIYSMSGATLIFIVLVFFMNYGGSLNFTAGGLLDMSLVKGHENMLRIVFLLGFFGFGVKAAVFPLHDWLPSASVAPTPVTALLHAVAVVKSGAFAIMRLIYFGFGADFLRGSAVQHIALTVSAVTIVFGSAMALRSPHLKRRLAYSTVSNLSYIVFAFALMTEGGFVGGLAHMIYHAVIKITLFFCAGAILHQSEREYVYELEGMAKRMPVTAAAFTVASLGLMGIPPLGGFISKFTIGSAAAALNDPFATLGAVALILSAVLTILYMVTVIVRLYFPLQSEDLTKLSELHEADWRMTVPLGILTVLALLLALSSKGILAFLQGVGGAAV